MIVLRSSAKSKSKYRDENADYDPSGSYVQYTRREYSGQNTYSHSFCRLKLLKGVNYFRSKNSPFANFNRIYLYFLSKQSLDLISSFFQNFNFVKIYLTRALMESMDFFSILCNSFKKTENKKELRSIVA